VHEAKNSPFFMGRMPKGLILNPDEAVNLDASILE
jgi:hypothetical protein